MLKLFFIKLIGFIGNIGVSLFIAGILSVIFNLHQDANLLLLLIYGIITILSSAFLIALLEGENNGTN